MFSSKLPGAPGKPFKFYSKKAPHMFFIGFPFAFPNQPRTAPLKIQHKWGLKPSDPTQIRHKLRFPQVKRQPAAFYQLKSDTNRGAPQQTATRTGNLFFGAQIKHKSRFPLNTNSSRTRQLPPSPEMFVPMSKIPSTVTKKQWLVGHPSPFVGGYQLKQSTPS